MIKTDASAEDVITFYRERFEDAGFKAAVMTMQAEGTAATLVVTSPDEKRTANIFVVTADGVTQGTITFVQKR